MFLPFWILNSQNIFWNWRIFEIFSCLKSYDEFSKRGTPFQQLLLLEIPRKWEAKSNFEKTVPSGLIRAPCGKCELEIPTHSGIIRLLTFHSIALKCGNLFKLDNSHPTLLEYCSPWQALNKNVPVHTRVSCDFDAVSAAGSTDCRPQPPTDTVRIGHCITLQALDSGVGCRVRQNWLWFHEVTA